MEFEQCPQCEFVMSAAADIDMLQHASKEHKFEQGISKNSELEVRVDQNRDR